MKGASPLILLDFPVAFDTKRTLMLSSWGGWLGWGLEESYGCSGLSQSMDPRRCSRRCLFSTLTFIFCLTIPILIISYSYHCLTFIPTLLLFSSAFQCLLFITVFIVLKHFCCHEGRLTFIYFLLM